MRSSLGEELNGEAAAASDLEDAPAVERVEIDETRKGAAVRADVRRRTRGEKTRASSSRKYSRVPGSNGIGSPTSYDIGFRFHQPAGTVGRLALQTTLQAVLPSAVKRGLREGARGVGTATSFARTLPDFLIVGAQKSGTTALYAYLLRHPGIAGPASKEVEFFNRFFARGTRWYRGHFPTALTGWYVRRRHGLPLICGEASPDYLSHPWAAARAASVVPGAKLIVLLRNPIDRALSSYAHEVAAGRETLPFRDALERESERTGAEFERMLVDPGYYGAAWRYHSYLARGRYAEQLDRWFAAFPRESFLVLGSEAELFRDPEATYARVLEHLGAAPYSLDAYPAVLAREYEAMDADTRRWLEDYYREPNARLYELLGRDFGWS